MVHRMDSAAGWEKSCRRRVIVKSEFDNHALLSKRPRIDFPQQQVVGGGGDELREYNPLEEASPLGLKLKKSPSLLDLIEMRLSQQDKSPSLAKTLATKHKTTSTTLDKLKASNFPASLLKIGTWEYSSRYEGDLVAKCYFAKHKLVWEVLDGGLKNKIEIQWSDIMAIKPKYPHNGPDTLDVVLSRQPLFFREINPQPRKHTLWQATTDFTTAQATLHRQHFLQFPQGTLQKHFQKLMHCDPRLRFLSQQPQILLQSPPILSIFPDSNHTAPPFAFKPFTFSPSPSPSPSLSGLSSSDMDYQQLFDSTLRHKLQPHICSISETFSVEGDLSSKTNEPCGLNLLNQIKLPGLHPSMSVGDLINHIGDCISEQMKSDNPKLAINEPQKMNILEEISQYLLNDSQPISDSDEKSIMSRVNSLCCLLQKDGSGAENLPVFPLTVGGTHNTKGVNQTAEKAYGIQGENHHGHTTPCMSRKDSFSELLLHLPRIASLPQFLNSVPEDPSEL